MSVTIDELQLAIEHLSNAVNELKDMEVASEKPCEKCGDAVVISRNDAGVLVPADAEEPEVTCTDYLEEKFHFNSKMTKAELLEVCQNYSEELKKAYDKANQYRRENDMLFEKTARAAQEVIKLDEENSAFKEKMKSVVSIEKYNEVNDRLLKCAKELSLLKLNSPYKVTVNRKSLEDIVTLLSECSRKPEHFKDIDIRKASNSLRHMLREHHRRVVYEAHSDSDGD